MKPEKVEEVEVVKKASPSTTTGSAGTNNNTITTVISTNNTIATTITTNIITTTVNTGTSSTAEPAMITVKELRATQVLLILKWGGDLTPLGRKQAEELG